MSIEIVTSLVTEYFAGGWRMAPFRKSPDGYIGVKAWPKRAAKSPLELQALIEELQLKFRTDPILGVVPPSGRYVVDIDVKKNLSALQLWKDHVIGALGQYVEPALIVKTKSGGYHLYYSDGSNRQLHSPTSVFNKDSGIDIRGYTGMVIAPTSIGTEMDWQPGQYVVIRGRPTDALSVLPLSKIIGDDFDEVDVFLRDLLSQVNEALRNPNVPDNKRHLLLGDALVIPSSSRDNTLYRCAKLCRLAGVSQESALRFMQALATRCEATLEEPLEHWVKLASDKVARVYGNDAEGRLVSISQLFEELDNSGCVMLNGVSKSYFYFRLGSPLLRIRPRSKFATDNVNNVLQGQYIKTDEGDVPVKKAFPAYRPKEVAYSDAMYPRDLQFFEFEGHRYVNSYIDPFAGFEPDSGMLVRASEFVERFQQFARHITGYDDGDEKRLLDKLAWIVQRPYRKMPTGTIIFSHTRGSGKDVFMSIIREIVGRPYYMPITLQSIEDPHTVMHDKLVCTASEVQLQTNARGNVAAASFMGILKDKISQQRTYVNEKFIQPYSAPWFVNFFVLSNFELSSLIETDDRRWDVFHATEEKLNQDVFGDLADLGNDGIWIERDAAANALRKHIIWSIRQFLKERQVDPYFDRQEAVQNQVKAKMLEHKNPPAIEWMIENLPTYFTEEILMIACHFCPYNIRPEYALRAIKDHLGPGIVTLARPGQSYGYKMRGAPIYEVVSDGMVKTPRLRFDNASLNRIVYVLKSRPMMVDFTEGKLRSMMQRWYLQRVNEFHGRAGDPTQLPAIKVE